MKMIYDKSGKVRYSIASYGKKKIVRNAAGQVIGYMQDEKTYDASGRLVAYGEDLSSLTE